MPVLVQSQMKSKVGDIFCLKWRLLESFIRSVAGIWVIMIIIIIIITIMIIIAS